MTNAASPDTGFPASTPVLTPDGLTPIGELRAGDVVASKDVATGESGFWPVLETHALPGTTFLAFTSFDGQQEAAVWCGLRQRFWVPTEVLADPQFLPPRDGPPPVWAPVAGIRADWGSTRGWVRADDLTFGDQWIDASAVPVAAGWRHWKHWVLQTSRSNVAWTPWFTDHEIGTHFTFDDAGALVSVVNDVHESEADIGEPRRYRGLTRHLTVDRGHAFRVHEVGLLAADHTRDAGELMDVSTAGSAL